MPYFTVPVSNQKQYQLTFADLLNGVSDPAKLLETPNTFDTITRKYPKVPRRLENYPIDGKLQKLKDFCEKYQALIETKDKSSLYYSFKIPKRRGGLRPIDAPNQELMQALNELKAIFESTLRCPYHTAAFAYVKGRCHKDALTRHQRNKSKWFLHLDFHNFFGSTTYEFVVRQLKEIFPFSEIFKSWGKEYLEKALTLCFLRGGLPQGTPISPLITNLMMIPIDHAISAYCRDSSPHLVYTRYADDTIISSDRVFKWREVEKDLCEILQRVEAPFALNKEKTRFGSSAGRNWNLGLMLNKDNEITVGHAKKKNYTHMVHSFLLDYKKGQPWPLEDTRHLAGLTSYYVSIQKDVFTNITKNYSQKIGVDFYGAVKSILSAKSSY